MIKRLAFIIECVLLSVQFSFAQTPVSISVSSYSRPAKIPSDFIGLSFENDSLQIQDRGPNGYFFDPANRQLVMLFKNLGVKNLRIGGGSIDSNPTPPRKDIDELFHFAKAAGVRIIYSLRLMNGNPFQDASLAKYIWDHYRNQLVCFAIGNEPNLYNGRDPQITNDSTYFLKWKRFASVVLDSVPNAKFGGPDNGTHGTALMKYFARHEGRSGRLSYIFAHFYVGGSSYRKSRERLVERMLSQRWDGVKYLDYFDSTGAVALSLGIPYRLTESNSYVARMPGVWEGNNSFATALFVLDYMHWWSVHRCAGVNFHTVIGKYNGTIYRDSLGNYHVYPMAYGIKAFDIGGQGIIDSVSIINHDGMNLTAYAVSIKANTFITIINKEHGADARAANVRIDVPGKADSVMYLKSPGGNAFAAHGVKLGGASISGNTTWEGKWSVITSGREADCRVEVPPTSAAIVKIVNRSNNRRP